MAHALHHAESSARRFGGEPEDYLPLHSWLDQSKLSWAAPAHRALRHHATGIWDAERLFGGALTTSAGRRVPTRLVAERHVREDLGRIPSLQDWLGDLPLQPWMLGGRIEQGEEAEDEDRSVERWRAEVAAGRTILGWIEWAQGRGDASAVRPFLDVSTGCLTAETRARLEALDEADAPSTFLRGPYGWLVHVPEESGYAWPADLMAVLDHARRLRCDYVLLDADGPVLDALPSFEDEEEPS